MRLVANLVETSIKTLLAMFFGNNAPAMICADEALVLSQSSSMAEVSANELGVKAHFVAVRYHANGLVCPVI